MRKILSLPLMALALHTRVMAGLPFVRYAGTAFSSSKKNPLSVSPHRDIERQKGGTLVHQEGAFVRYVQRYDYFLKSANFRLKNNTF